MVETEEVEREAVYAKMASYGKIKWSTLIAAVGAAIGTDWKPEHGDIHIGHEMVGPFNMNSLNRVVSYFVQEETKPLLDALAEARNQAGSWEQAAATWIQVAKGLRDDKIALRAERDALAALLREALWDIPASRLRNRIEAALANLPTPTKSTHNCKITLDFP